MKPNSPSPSAASSTTLAGMEESHIEDISINNAVDTSQFHTALNSETQQDYPPSAFRISRDEDWCKKQQRLDGDTSPLRTHEYFVSSEGIDQDVINADITLYLGNDALVRPGTGENPQTGQIVEGYYVTSYRNLTKEMIADLKVDSLRVQDEKLGNFKVHTKPDDVNGLPSQIPEEDVIRMVRDGGQVA